MSEDGDAGMKISQLRFEIIENCDPFNKRAKGNGMVTEWAAGNIPVPLYCERACGAERLYRF